MERQFTAKPADCRYRFLILSPSKQSQEWVLGATMMDTISSSEISLLMSTSAFTVPSEVENQISTLENEGKTAMILSIDNNIAGLIGVADTLKEHSAEAIRQLEAMGIQVVMLTGDNERTARTIAKKLGIERVLSQVLPDQKERVIRELQQGGEACRHGRGWSERRSCTGCS